MMTLTRCRPGCCFNITNKIFVQHYCENNESKDEGSRSVKEFPEAPTTCCMSGCANCVWLEYAEQLTEYFKDGGGKALEEINERVTDNNIKAFLLHELRMRYKQR